MASKISTQLVIEGKNNSRQAFDEVNKSLDSMNKQISTAGKALIGAFSVSALTGAVRGIAAAADTYNLMYSRLRLVTQSQDEFNKAQSELKRIAVENQAPIQSLLTLYNRLAPGMRDAGRSQEEVLKVTEAVAASFRVSGASVAEAQGAVVQFGQAMASGALRGEEFNSVAEQAPRLMRALSDSLGVPIGALKEMATQGLLTADIVSNALTSQLDVLRKEAESLPETVGGAMTALTDQWNEAIGQADVQPLIDAIESLGATISDPATRDSLMLLASALIAVAEAAIKAGAGTVSLAQDLGYIAARITGNVAEIDRAAKELEKFEAAAQGFGMLDLYMTDEQINKGLKEWRAYYAALTEDQSGMNAEMEFLLDVAAAVADSARQQEVDARTKYIGDLKRLQDQEVKAAETQSKALVSAQKKANADLEKIRQERTDIEKRYSTALAELGGGAGEASFSAAQNLKVGADKALRAGDVEGAQAQARAALKTLQDLAAAGENTYGFEGFIKQLQAIDLAANEIEQGRAEDKITAIGVSIATLAADAEKLKGMPVSVKADDASIEAVRAQIQKLAADLGNTEIVIPVRVATPGSDTAEPQQFATGGQVRGPGSGTSDSIPALLSNGEYVIRAAAVRKLGKGYLDLINNGIPISRFADGGIAESVASMPAGPSFPELGSLSINMGGENVNVYASPGEALNLQRLASKFGRTRR